MGDGGKGGSVGKARQRPVKGEPQQPRLMIRARRRPRIAGRQQFGFQDLRGLGLDFIVPSDIGVVEPLDGEQAQEVRAIRQGRRVRAQHQRPPDPVEQQFEIPVDIHGLGHQRLEQMIGCQGERHGQGLAVADGGPDAMFQFEDDGRDTGEILVPHVGGRKAGQERRLDRRIMVHRGQAAQAAGKADDRHGIVRMGFEDAPEMVHRRHAVAETPQHRRQSRPGVDVIGTKIDESVEMTACARQISGLQDHIGEVGKRLDVVGAGGDGLGEGVDRLGWMSLGPMHDAEDVEGLGVRWAGRRHRGKGVGGGLRPAVLELGTGQIDARRFEARVRHDGGLEMGQGVDQVAAIGGHDTEQVEGVRMIGTACQDPAAQGLGLYHLAGRPKARRAGKGAGGLVHRRHRSIVPSRHCCLRPLRPRF